MDEKNHFKHFQSSTDPVLWHLTVGIVRKDKKEKMKQLVTYVVSFIRTGLQMTNPAPFISVLTGIVCLICGRGWNVRDLFKPII